MIRSVFATRNQSRLAVALAGSLLAACSGGSGTPSTQLPTVPTPAVQPTPGTQPSSKLTAQFTISVPHAASTASSTRTPKYVSSNTGSVRISILSADSVAVHLPDTVAAIAYGAPGCASASSQPLTCTIQVAAPTGNAVAFTVSTYQSSNGSGAVLSTGTVSAPVTAGKTNSIPITLGGVAASIAVSPSTLPMVQDGQLHIFHLTVNAIDASGATIIDSTPLANPVAFAITGDSNSALQLSTANLTTPGQLVQLTYNGKIALNSATITANVGSFKSSLTVNPLQVSPISVKLQPNGKTLPITVHENGFTGQFTATLGDTTLATLSASPTSSGTSTITLTSAAAVQGKTTLTIGDGTVSVSVPYLVAPVLFNYFNAGLQVFSQLNFIANGSNGKFFFTDQGANEVGVFDPSTGFSTEYKQGLGSNDIPDQIVMGSDGNAYFTDLNSSNPSIGSMNPSTGAITLYSVFANGVPTQITLGPDHNIWYTDASFGQFQLGVFNTATHSATEYPLTPSASVQGMTAGPDGRVWFTDSGSHAIGAMDPATQAFTEYTTGIQSFANPRAITTGPDGNLWFIDQRWGHVAVGKVVPSTGAITEYPVTLPGSGAQLNGIVSAHGKLWVTAPALFGGGSSIASVDPATGQFTDYSFGISNTSTPFAAVLGPDNELWFGDTANMGQAILP